MMPSTERGQSAAPFGGNREVWRGRKMKSRQQLGGCWEACQGNVGVKSPGRSVLWCSTAQEVS